MTRESNNVSVCMLFGLGCRGGGLVDACLPSHSTGRRDVTNAAQCFGVHWFGTASPSPVARGAKTTAVKAGANELGKHVRRTHENTEDKTRPSLMR